jgi:hypothetical protein
LRGVTRSKGREQGESKELRVSSEQRGVGGQRVEGPSENNHGASEWGWGHGGGGRYWSKETIRGRKRDIEIREQGEDSREEEGEQDYDRHLCARGRNYRKLQILWTCSI